MLAYLEYRMKQEHVTKSDIQSLLGVSEKTVRNKFSGETSFTWEEVRLIRNTFFPKDDFENLFEQSDE